MKRRIAAIFAAIALALPLGACSDADVASRNLSNAADNFEVPRRIVFYNGVTGDYILEIVGYCSLNADGQDSGKRVSITCKVGPDEFKKHYLDESDNVTLFAEQVAPSVVSTEHYRVTFKPSTIVPTIDVH